MGKAGPPKKPTNLKLLQGVPGGEHKLNKNEAKPKLLDEAPAPDWLCEQGKEIWEELTLKLTRNGLLSEIDQSMFARYCDQAARWFEAREYILTHGTTFETYDSNGNLIHKEFPQSKIYKELGKDLTRLEAHFGMSPSSRAGISAIKLPDAGKDGFKNKLYGGGRK